MSQADEAMCVDMAFCKKKGISEKRQHTRGKVLWWRVFFNPVKERVGRRKWVSPFTVGGILKLVLVTGRSRDGRLFGPLSCESDFRLARMGVCKKSGGEEIAIFRFSRVRKLTQRIVDERRDNGIDALMRGILKRAILELSGASGPEQGRSTFG